MTTQINTQSCPYRLGGGYYVRVGGVVYEMPWNYSEERYAEDVTAVEAGEWEWEDYDRADEAVPYEEWEAEWIDFPQGEWPELVTGTEPA